MGGRWFHIAVLISWLLSMTWLFVEKVVPTFRGGVRPAFDGYGAESDPSPEPVGWRLKWDDEEIGWAVIRSIRQPDDGVVMRTIVQLENLPLDSRIMHLLGAIGPVFPQSDTVEGDLRLDFSVVTSTELSADGEVQRFESSIHIGRLRDLMRVEGMVDGRRMEVVIYRRWTSAQGDDEPQEFSRHEVNLPANALIGDVFSPQPRLANLHVGQRWTFPIYRPFPLAFQTEIIEAHVEREMNMFYEDQVVPVRQVVFRREAGSGISAAQEPTGCMWVDYDGTVLHQEVRLANVRLRFRRAPGGQFHERARRLDPGWDNLGVEPQER